MTAPTATADASLYRTSGVYRSAPGVRSGPSTVVLAGNCYNDCVSDCPSDWESYECKQFCQNECAPGHPPPCQGELCLFGPQRHCCPYGSSCSFGYEYPSGRQVIGCCASGQTGCNGGCCAEGRPCCGNKAWPPPKCCAPGEECCDGVCYTPGQGTVCTSDGVCPQDRLCGVGCCYPGEVCKDGTCLKPGPPCPGAIGGRCREGEQCATNGKCCPQERYTATLGCCEPGQVACKVKVWPPSGPESDPEPYIQEQCCPPGFTCADGACCPPGECCENNTPCPRESTVTRASAARRGRGQNSIPHQEESAASEHGLDTEGRCMK